jgi:putative ABC transport system ATP-binding protein
VRTRKKGLLIGTGKDFRDTASAYLATLQLGLERRLHTKVNTLSGGQRQSLTLLMAVADDCDVLLMDEPTAALDPKTADSLMQMTETITREKELTTMIITHNINDAVNYGNRFIMMKEGAIVVDHRKEESGALTVEMIAGWFRN